MTEQNGNGKEKIRIHEDIAILKTQVKAIMENHLPHILKAIDKLSAKFWAIVLLLIANLITLIFMMVYK